MLDTYRQLIANQFDAALCTLNACVERCPDTIWNARIGNYAFCQVTFHTLFYVDFYLDQSEQSFRRQPFHRDNGHRFGDYEELQDRAPITLYDKPLIRAYLQHCRDKASSVVAAETAATLNARSGFEWLAFSRAELHLYNVRHIQHHAAQLSLRLRIDANENVPWVGSGWCDV